MRKHLKITRFRIQRKWHFGELEINLSGYFDTVFADKKTQATQVQELLQENGFIPQELIASEVAWFYEYVILAFYG